MVLKTIFSRIALLIITGCCLLQSASVAQSVLDSRADVPGNVPQWADLSRLSVVQNGKLLSITIEVADSIPKEISDSCQFQILLQIEPGGTPSDQSVPSAIIGFDLTHWDGSPWFATNFYAKFSADRVPADTIRMFDWKLAKNSFRVRFSLESLGWSRVRAKSRIFFGSGFADSLPDSGWLSVAIDRSGFQSLKTRAGSRSSFTYPEDFDSIIRGYHVLKLVDAAYRYESNLTGVTPVGGDVIRFIFNPFYDGAAIEGDPIYLGPGMWGRSPLWFVYFHEMGHNFVNATSRFCQLYPLEMRLVPGPLPAHILFYEAWASLPAMYVYDAIDRKGGEPGVPDSALRNVLDEWHSTKARFQKAWEAYKSNPDSAALDPDVVDGMFLELKDRFGWDIFRRFFALMRPADSTLAVFGERHPGDTPDLRTTRFTLTAAALGASAGTDLRKEFIAWGFPIDEGLYLRASSEFAPLIRQD